MVFVLGGEAALAALSADMFDVLVTDLNMPAVDGIAVLAAAKLRSPRTVRIMWTASSIDTASIDADAVLAKPYDPDELRRFIESALNSLK